MSGNSKGWIHRSSLDQLEGSPIKAAVQPERSTRQKDNLKETVDKNVPFFQAIGRSRLLSEEEVKEGDDETVSVQNTNTSFIKQSQTAKHSPEQEKQNESAVENPVSVEDSARWSGSSEHEEVKVDSPRHNTEPSLKLLNTTSPRMITTRNNDQPSNGSYNTETDEPGKPYQTDSETRGFSTTKTAENTSSIRSMIQHATNLAKGNQNNKPKNNNSDSVEAAHANANTRRSLREQLRHERSEARSIAGTKTIDPLEGFTKPKLKVNTRAPSSRILSLYHSAKKKQDKLERRREEVATEGCTFSPKITHRATRHVTGPGQTRFERLYKNAGHVQKRLESKRQLEKDSLTFTPESFTKRRSNSRVSSDEPRHQLLFRRAKRTQDRLDAMRRVLPDECTFVPVITKKASKLESSVMDRRNWDPDALRKKNEALEELRKETELQGCTFEPELTHQNPQHVRIYRHAIGDAADGHKPISSVNEPVHARLHRFEFEKLEKLAQRAKEQLERDVEGCTFQPFRISTLSRLNQGEGSSAKPTSVHLDSLFYRLYFHAEEQRRRREQLVHEFTMLETNGGFKPNGRDAVWNPERIDRLVRYGTERLFDNLCKFKDPAWRHSLDIKKEQEDLAHCTFHPRIASMDIQDLDEDGNPIDRFDRLYQDALEKRERLEDHKMMLDVEASMLQARVYSAKSIKLFEKLDDQRAVSPTREKGRLLELERQANEYSIAHSPRREEFISYRRENQDEFQDAVDARPVPQLAIPGPWNSKASTPEVSPGDEVDAVGETVEYSEDILKRQEVLGFGGGEQFDVSQNDEIGGNSATVEEVGNPPELLNHESEGVEHHADVHQQNLRSEQTENVGLQASTPEREPETQLKALQSEDSNYVLEDDSCDGSSIALAVAMEPRNQSSHDSNPKRAATEDYTESEIPLAARGDSNMLTFPGKQVLLQNPTSPFDGATTENNDREIISPSSVTKRASDNGRGETWDEIETIPQEQETKDIGQTEKEGAGEPTPNAAVAAIIVDANENLVKLSPLVDARNLDTQDYEGTNEVTELVTSDGVSDSMPHLAEPDNGIFSDDNLLESRLIVEEESEAPGVFTTPTDDVTSTVSRKIQEEFKVVEDDRVVKGERKHVASTVNNNVQEEPIVVADDSDAKAEDKTAAAAGSDMIQQEYSLVEEDSVIKAIDRLTEVSEGRLGEGSEWDQKSEAPTLATKSKFEEDKAHLESTTSENEEISGLESKTMETQVVSANDADLEEEWEEFY